jgi:hypothetical protein
MWVIDTDGNEVWRPARRAQGHCQSCGAYGPINNVYDSHSADIIGRLCDTCNEKRITDDDRFYRGE